MRPLHCSLEIYKPGQLIRSHKKCNEGDNDDTDTEKRGPGFIKGNYCLKKYMIDRERSIIN